MEATSSELVDTEQEQDAQPQVVTAPAPQLSEQEGSKGEGSTSQQGLFVKLSKEQLIEYTKRQKKEIKKLRADLAEQQKLATQQQHESQLVTQDTSAVNSFDLFWELLDRRPAWQQQLARVSLSALLGRAKALRTSARLHLQSAFSHWSAQTSRAGLLQTSSILEENRAANTHLEQRCAIAPPPLPLQYSSTAAERPQL